MVCQWHQDGAASAPLKQVPARHRGAWFTAPARRPFLVAHFPVAGSICAKKLHLDANLKLFQRLFNLLQMVSTWVMNFFQGYIPRRREQLVATIHVQFLLCSQCVTSCARVQVNVLREEHENSDGRVKDALAGKEDLATQLSKVMKVMLVESVQERARNELGMQWEIRPGRERDSMEDGQGGSENFFAVARARSRVRVL